MAATVAPKTQILLALSVGLLSAAGMAWCDGDRSHARARTASPDPDPAVATSIEEYHLGAPRGTALERCVHAQLVIDAKRRAGDRHGFDEWQTRQAENCGPARGAPGNAAALAPPSAR